MKVSLEWLKDHVMLPESEDELCDVLTGAGTEVIGRERRGEVPEKIVVAEILSSEPHPNADRLSVCRVNDGSGQPRQIVCGAKNYKVGDKVPLALPGAVLGPDFKIKSGKLRGVVSDGMMCSAKELALAEDAEGLLILPAESLVGQPVADIFPSDTVVELEVTPNRPDLLGHAGVAREIAAITGQSAKVRQVLIPPEKSAGEYVKLQDEGCPFYSARIIRGVRVGPSPKWLADRLAAVGLRPINNIVDVTNYVLMETGQPLHAFDLARLDGGIVVRKANEGERLAALDGSDAVLRSGDLVIADAKKAVALAGVIGGAETGVTKETADILLESAWFQPSCVRKTSRELGVSTDSSYRFERRVDPASVLAASARGAELISEVAGGSAEPEVLVAGRLPDSGARVSMDNNRCRALLGCDITDNEIEAILQRLGLSKSENEWIVPGFRPDLAREVDLIEEVIRLAGIDRVPSRLRGFPAAATCADLRHDRAERLRERLRAQGFSEARTSHFVSADALSATGLEVAGSVAIRNPLGSDQALLRPTLLAGLLGALGRNMRHGAKSVLLFELGTVFGCGDREEQTALSLIAAGQDADFHKLKGTISAVLGEVHFGAAIGLAQRIDLPGVSGTLRRLPRSLVAAHNADGAVYFAELLVDGWLETTVPPVHVQALPKFPSVERDLSLLLSQATAYAAVEKSMRAAQVPHLRSVVLKDVFADAGGRKLPVGQKSVTVTLTFREEDRTLTSDEVDRAVEALRDHAKAELGADFRA